MPDCLAERVGLSCAYGAASQTGSCAAALVEQGPHPQPHSARKQNGPARGPYHFLEERVGFEPTVRVKRTPDFESGPFDHSGTSPLAAVIVVSFEGFVKYAF